MLNQRRNLPFWAIVSGAVLFLASFVAGCDIGPDLFSNLDELFAALFGILFGAGISTALKNADNRRDRITVAVFALVVGLAYLVISTVPQVRNLLEKGVSDPMEPWLDLYVAAGGAIGGAGLSILLTRHARQSSEPNEGERSNQRGAEDADRPSRSSGRKATSERCSAWGFLLFMVSFGLLALLSCMRNPPPRASCPRGGRRARR